MPYKEQVKILEHIQKLVKLEKILSSEIEEEDIWVNQEFTKFPAKPKSPDIHKINKKKIKNLWDTWAVVWLRNL